LMEGRTTFMITHRLDTLSASNIILHLEERKLLEIVKEDISSFVQKKKLSYLDRIQVN